MSKLSTSVITSSKILLKLVIDHHAHTVTQSTHLFICSSDCYVVISLRQWIADMLYDNGVRAISNLTADLPIIYLLVACIKIFSF